MLMKGQMEYLLSIIPEGERHDELRNRISYELNRYEKEEQEKIYEDEFVRFMRIHRWYCSGNYSFYYDDGAVNVFDDSRMINMGGIYSANELAELIENIGLPELRFCSYCGAPMEAGFTDGLEYFCCEEEFYHKLDIRYGADHWREEPTGKLEYYYECLYEDGWRPLEWYYTEWN